MTEKQLITLTGKQKLSDRDWDYIDETPTVCFRCKIVIDEKDYPTATTKLVRAGWVGQRMVVLCLLCKDYGG